MPPPETRRPTPREGNRPALNQTARGESHPAAPRASLCEQIKARLTLREIPPCPPAGSGVHREWMMRAAWACRFNGMTPEQAAAELHARITRRPDPANEIETAVQKVYATTERLVSRHYGPGPGKWPAPNREQIEAVAASGVTVADLWEESPVRLGDPPQTSAVLPVLFPGDPLLCVGTRSDFYTMTLSDFAPNAHAFEQIVPSPMLAKYGRTKEGKLSQHTLEATGARRFLVVEGDKLDGETIPKDTQAAVLLHLAERAPLALAVDSGGKSLHGWFYCASADEAKLRRFFAYAVTLGADPALWTRSQFVRMPDGPRDNGTRQSILYFNPQVIR